MALKDALLEICDDMESGNSDDVRDYARQIRLAIKAAESVQLPAGSFDEFGRYHSQNRHLFASMPKEEVPTGMPERLAEMVGGSCDRAMLPIPNSLTAGMKTMINGEVYRYQDDGKLHFDHEETAKSKEKGTSC